MREFSVHALGCISRDKEGLCAGYMFSLAGYKLTYRK